MSVVTIVLTGVLIASAILRIFTPQWLEDLGSGAAGAIAS